MDIGEPVARRPWPTPTSCAIGVSAPLAANSNRSELQGVFMRLFAARGMTKGTRSSMGPSALLQIGGVASEEIGRRLSNSVTSIL